MKMNYFIPMLLLFLNLISCAQTGNKEYKQSDKEFERFIKDVQQIILKKDTTKLKDLLEENVKTLSDNTGKDAFFDYWELNQNPNNSPIWIILERLLKQEYAQTSTDSYIFPKSTIIESNVKYPFYVSENTTLYRDSLQIEQLGILKKATIVSVDKSSLFNQKTFLSLNPRFQYEACQNCLIEVVTADKGKGFVKSESIWSIEDGIYIIFQFEGNIWKINSLLISG